MASTTTTPRPQSKISRYFSTSQGDTSAAGTDRTQLVMKAMKKEWWYDMFDVDQSQFDVRQHEFSISSAHSPHRSNCRVNSNCFEQFSTNVNPLVINCWSSLGAFWHWTTSNSGSHAGVLERLPLSGPRVSITFAWTVGVLTSKRLTRRWSSQEKCRLSNAPWTSNRSMNRPTLELVCFSFQPWQAALVSISTQPIE